MAKRIEALRAEWRYACVLLRVGLICFVGGIAIFIASRYQIMGVTRIGTGLFCVACVWMMVIESRMWRAWKEQPAAGRCPISQ